MMKTQLTSSAAALLLAWRAGLTATRASIAAGWWPTASSNDPPAVLDGCELRDAGPVHNRLPRPKS